MVTDQASLILRRAVDPDRSFADHGLDSLGTLELRTHIETQTGVRVTPKTIVTYNTPRTLAGHLTETLEAGDRLAGDAAELSPPSARTPPSPSAWTAPG